ncbi:unnamed protein product [Ilex paraguariensis]|uniref:Retroviral polymerase SH3-like domain-containing protein n=1 Tax=Ilex paraguariensis TaxID=185542 RepID=A0ABC8T165_9AQUA
MVRYMLRGMGVLKFYWHFVVLTSSFLCNCIPSRVLQHKTPLQVLFPKRTLFSIPPCIFGCTYFVQNRSSTRHKLDDKAICYIFVGYCHQSKGYRYYDPIRRHMYHNLDVTFLEHILYFSSGLVFAPPVDDTPFEFSLPYVPEPLVTITTELPVFSLPEPFVPVTTESPVSPHLQVYILLRYSHSPNVPSTSGDASNISQFIEHIDAPVVSTDEITCNISVILLDETLTVEDDDLGRRYPWCDCRPVVRYGWTVRTLYSISSYISYGDLSPTY